MERFNPSIQNGATVNADVIEFLRQSRKMLIGGRWCESVSGRRFETFNPATGAPLARVAEADAQDIDLAVQAARKAFDQSPWRKTVPAERARMLWKLADLLDANIESLTQLESLNQGMHLQMAKFAGVGAAARSLRYMSALARGNHGITTDPSPPRPDLDLFTCTLKEPIGVVGQIVPWNFPLLMAVWKIGPALAAGCTAVLKPAEQTPLTALRLGELALEAGFPEGVLNIVPGFGETAGAALASHPGVDKIAFTGSTEVGRKIVQASARSNLKKLTLELGGKSANVVFPDADLQAAIPAIAGGITFNQGQLCFAGSRLYVHHSLHAQILDGLANEFGKLKTGHGFDPNAQVCPLVSLAQLRRVEQYVQIGKDEGAEVRFGGQRLSGEGYFVQPTLFSAGRNSMRVVREEIFGPVLSVLPFSDTDHAVTLANDSNYGLAAGVWTRDIGLAHRTVRALKAGTVWVNGYNILDQTMAFGGYRESGWGRELGPRALDAYSEEKSVMFKL